MINSVTNKYLFLFFLSGFSTLTFEIIWQRWLVLTFGASAPATTATLSAILFGLALGSLIAGRLIHKTQSILKLYAITELWICIWAISVPLLLRMVDQMQITVLSEIAPSSSLFFILRFFMTILVILPATLGMGATIPMMNKMIYAQNQHSGLSVAMAYGINTLGAVIGCFSTGFVLIARLGLLNSSLLAGSINFIIFLSVFFFLKPSASELNKKDQKHNASIDLKTKGAHPHSNVLIMLYCFSSFLALGYEILWFRLLGIIGTNSIITFTVGLSTYLLGMSLGSLFFYPKMRRYYSAHKIFFLSNWGTGLFVILSIPFYYWLTQINPLDFLKIFGFLQNTFQLFIIRETLMALILIFTPTIFMGLAFPAICELINGDEKDIGTTSGDIYFLGTLSSVFGVILIQSLIPQLNLMGGIAFLTAESLLISLLIATFKEKKARFPFSFTTFLTFLLICTTLGYGAFGNPIMKTGQVVKAEDKWMFKNQNPGEILSLIKYKSGPTATVSVIETAQINKPPIRMLYVDDQSVAATEFWSRMDSKLLAHIPLMLHPNPQKTITVGYGAGVTSHSMTQYGIETECVEIEPEVFRSTELFKEYNHDVPKKENFTIILNDARNHFHLTENKYDVISTDVTNLNYKNNSSLYTREYFELLKSKLTSNGIVGAWVPMGGVSDYEFKILLKTFQSVFPHTSVWFAEQRETSYYSIFIGTQKTVSIDYTRLKSLFLNPDINADLAEVHIFNPLKLISYLLLDEIGVTKYVGDVPIHTDNHPILEFYPINEWTSEVNFKQLIQHIPNNLMDYIRQYKADEKPVIQNYLNGKAVQCNRKGECRNKVMAKPYKY